ncbi:S1 domain-containing post-transcriptional regulator GSP13 [Ectobacillus ponti]|uniref:S1 domain-containing post-transcriptional regulator GSP13 n=1 Tax=Ectobacillus ponti TaxID=2961894 RepID=A0AA41XBH0_9BACI|nr:S1 domain-containing post-transcriptional regulator GSP13 [Ectobacillus ponti]MCP8969818.1 S1 domain-containing post-transcriptional regulator GSP13 [Ectobacillus ponti]
MPDKYYRGTIVQGTVTGIQGYGAFVALDESTQGLVHISEITDGYVKDIRDFLKVGDQVRVRVLAVDEASGKISLSLKAAQETPVREARKQATMRVPKPASDGFNTLREKLQDWIAQSSHQNTAK